MYVWFDALANYITRPRLRRRGRRPPVSGSGATILSRVHVIGKDIVRFHAVYWPAMLLSAGPAGAIAIVVHGFLTRDGQRMSKTLGTGVDPTPLVR